jgi:hypothetical protein
MFFGFLCFCCFLRKMSVFWRCIRVKHGILENACVQQTKLYNNAAKSSLYLSCIHEGTRCTPIFLCFCCFVRSSYMASFSFKLPIRVQKIFCAFDWKYLKVSIWTYFCSEPAILTHAFIWRTKLWGNHEILSCINQELFYFLLSFMLLLLLQVRGPQWSNQNLLTAAIWNSTTASEEDIYPCAFRR